MPDLVFSVRNAILAAGAPLTGPSGAPVSWGWRVRWVCDRLTEARRERDKARAQLAAVHDALGNGADERVWPPGQTVAETIEGLIAEITRLRILGPDTEARVTVEARTIAAELLTPIVYSWRAKVEAVEVERDETRDAWSRAAARWTQQRERLEREHAEARAEADRFRAALDAIARAGETTGCCLPTCSSWSEDYRVNDCDCGYVEAASDPAVFAREALGVRP